MKELEIYIHIPFCVKKCAYCDFLSAPADRQIQRRYLEALKEEIRETACCEGRTVRSVFFGGGTPSILPPEEIDDLMQCLRAHFHISEAAEITIECNPGTAEEEKLQSYVHSGINRLSIGLQSADDRELKKLGRIHDWNGFLRTYLAARKAGFGNINVDLMSALPGQTLQSWENTLQKVLALKPEHISAYSLIIEEGTPFYERYAEDVRIRESGETPVFLPSEEAERMMYCRTEELLNEAGLQRYEISNYALPGYECRHNTGYWDGTEYIGFGLGASSLLEHTRYRNTDRMERYLDGKYLDQEAVQQLTEQDQMEEFMFLGLRMTAGVSGKSFHERFGRSMESVYGGIIEKLVKNDLLISQGDVVKLSRRGLDVGNLVMAEFLLG